METNSKYSIYRLINIFCLISLLCSWNTIPLYGQMIKVPLEQISVKSTMIIRGTVLRKWSEFEPGGKNIITFVTYKVTETIKGDSRDTVTIVIPGGIVGNIGMAVSHTPRFKVGEDAVVFISDDYKGRLTVTEGLQGKFPVVNGIVFYESAPVGAVEFLQALKTFVAQKEHGTIKISVKNNPINFKSGTLNSVSVVPNISSISPSGGSASRPYSVNPNDPFNPGERGTILDIYGSGFGSSKGSSKVSFSGADAEVYLLWSDTHIQCAVPGGQWQEIDDEWQFPEASSGPVYVVTSGGTSNGVQFNVSFATSNKRYTSSSLTYYVNQNGTPDCDGEFAAIQSALQSWTGLSYSTHSFVYGGTTTRTPTGLDGHNDIGWIESNWPYKPSDVAVNAYWFNPDPNSQDLTESDIYLNGVNYTWSATGQAGRMDVQDLVTHESGHALSLSDLYGNTDGEKTMYGYTDPNGGETKKRTLEPDDIAGVRYLYPQQYSITFQNNFEFDGVGYGQITVQNSTEGTNTLTYNSPLSRTVKYGPTFVISTPVTSPIINGRNYFFSNWSDGSTSATRNFSATRNTTLSANFKIIHKSNDVTAFTRGSQRKLIQTQVNTTKWLHQVYTSMGHVWIEHSSNNGTTWTVGNGGQPLDGGTGSAKCPSIAYVHHAGWGNNYIGVVWQQQYGSTYTIQGKVFNQMSNVTIDPTYASILYTEPADPYSTNANPNLIFNGDFYAIYFVTFERKNASGSYQPGINWLAGKCGEYGGGQEQAFPSANPPGYVGQLGSVTETNASSINAAIALDPMDDGSYSNLDVMLVYQDNYDPQSDMNRIRQTWLWFWSSDQGNSWSYGQYPATPAILNDYCPNDYNPSVMMNSGENAMGCWIDNIPNNENGGWAEVDQMTFTQIGSSIFYYFGYGVQSCAINQAYDDYGPTGMSGFVTWSQIYNGAWSNKSIRFDYGTPVTSSLRTLNTTGKYVQLSNGTGTLNNMYVSSFYPFSAPYYFTTSQALVPVSKDNASTLVMGRGCIISKGNVSFSYRFGDLNVDGENIGFVDAPDTLDYSKIDILNNALVTGSFQLNANSKLVFTEWSGFADSALAMRALGESGYIRYKLELIDAATEKVIGAIKNNSLTSSNAHSLRIQSHQLDTKGLSDMTVKARITINTNLDSAKIALTKSIADVNIALAKSSLEELRIEKEQLPTCYALEQNYPNPFNPSTTIHYQITSRGHITLKVYDVLGREVATLVDGRKEAGSYTATFNGAYLSSGVYIMRLSATPEDGSKQFVQVKKMVLMK